MNKKAVAIIISIIGFLGIVLPMLYLETTVRNYQLKIESLQVGRVDLSKVPDGTYTGACRAVLVSAKVEVVVKNHVIESILLLEHNNGKGEIAGIIPQLVIDNQSLEIDTITGATASSKVILKSIENALRQYK